MFALLLRLYSQDFFDFYIRNYFRFLVDVVHKWLDNFDIEPFYGMINNLESDLEFIFDSPSKSLNFSTIRSK